MQVHITPTHCGPEIVYEYTLTYKLDNGDVVLSDRIDRLFPIDIASVPQLIRALETVLEAHKTVTAEDIDLYKNDVQIYMEYI